MATDIELAVKPVLESAGISPFEIVEREFPGERWIIISVSEDSIATGQSLAGDIEKRLSDGHDAISVTVFFRAAKEDVDNAGTHAATGRLSDRSVDRLIQLLEARSRTSDAVPSLRYMEDPRASLPAVAASRHHLVYGRRGVGKTALLLEVKRLVEERGNIAVWTNAHVIRHQDAESAFATVINAILLSIVQRSGTSSSDAISRIESLRAELEGDGSSSLAVSRIAEINRVLRSILRVDVLQLFVFLDDFYLLPASVQPQLLDYIAAALRDCDGWMKIASIERLTKSFEHSSRIGLEIPHDAVKVDLDVTLEDPKSAQTFLETVLNSYTSTAGISSHTKIAKTQALGRLILASGGVPRDYLNLFATSIVVARESRSQAAEIGKEDVAGAAGRFARSKKRDLEQDVDGAESASLLKALELLSSTVKGEKYTYFRVELSKKSSPGYEVLARLVDLRFVHLVQSSLSDQHLAGKKYEAYIIALSEYTDVRLQRGLNVLDIEHGSWVWQLTGKAGTSKLLAGTQLRDRLRQAPILDLDTLVSTV